MKEKRLKALFVVDKFSLGGIQTQSLNLAVYFTQKDIEVEYLSVRKDADNLCELLNEHHIRYYNRNLFKNTGARLRMAMDYIGLIRFLREKAYDVILPFHKDSSELFSAIYRLAGVKLCFFHILGGDSFTYSKPHWMRRIAMRNKPLYVTNSFHGRESFVKHYGIPEEEVYVIYNGLKIKPPQLNREGWRQNLDIPEKGFMALMLANYYEQKDHETVVKAWAEVINNHGDEQIFLVFAGSDPSADDDNIGRIKALSSKLGIEDKIRFLEHVNDNIGLIDASDLGILSSVSEGLPNTVLEFMSRGIPFVGTDIPGIREAIGSNYEYLFDIGDYKKLAGLIALFINMPDAGIIGAALKARFQTHFTREIMGGKYLELIRKKLGHAV